MGFVGCVVFSVLVVFFSLCVLGSLVSGVCVIFCFDWGWLAVCFCRVVFGVVFVGVYVGCGFGLGCFAPWCCGVVVFALLRGLFGCCLIALAFAFRGCAFLPGGRDGRFVGFLSWVWVFFADGC